MEFITAPLYGIVLIAIHVAACFLAVVPNSLYATRALIGEIDLAWHKVEHRSQSKHVFSCFCPNYNIGYVFRRKCASEKQETICLDLRQAAQTKVDQEKERLAEKWKNDNASKDDIKNDLEAYFMCYGATELYLMSTEHYKKLAWQQACCQISNEINDDDNIQLDNPNKVFNELQDHMQEKVEQVQNASKC